MQVFIPWQAEPLRKRPCSEEARMNRPSVVGLFDAVPETKNRRFKEMMKRLGQGRLARAFTPAPPDVYPDPYLLLLLADQELVEGREEQARYLVEAAYESFDRNTKASSSQSRLTR